MNIWQRVSLALAGFWVCIAVQWSRLAASLKSGQMTSEKSANVAPASSNKVAASGADDTALPENERAFKFVLQFNNPNSWAPDRKPFLYLLWLPDGNPRRGYRYIVSDNGRDWGDRILYNWAVQSGDQMGVKPDVLAALLQVHSLPLGVAGPDSMPPARFLAVGLRTGTTWTMRYYDRQNLPAEIVTIAQLTKQDSILLKP